MYMIYVESGFSVQIISPKVTTPKQLPLYMSILCPCGGVVLGIKWMCTSISVDERSDQPLAPAGLRLNFPCGPVATTTSCWPVRRLCFLQSRTRLEPFEPLEL